MNLWEFLLGVVLIGSIVSIVRARYGIRTDNQGNQYPGRNDDAKTRRLEEEVTQLRDRLAVLERITVEKENSLAREIDSLRDR